MGYAVTGVVTNGEDAIRRVEEMSPDLVVMDISLRGEMDGVEAANRIREQFGTPVVYITGHGDPDTLQRAKIHPGIRLCAEAGRGPGDAVHHRIGPQKGRKHPAGHLIRPPWGAIGSSERITPAP